MSRILTPTMNVLIISWHDLGCHLGCYGRPDVRSPALDRLAAEGARLGLFFAANPICSPSRASLLSGLYPHRHGLQGLVHDGWRLHEGVRLAEEFFQAAGYHTAIVGYQHERPKDASPCDERWADSTRAQDVAPAVCERLRQYAGDGRNFFLRAGFFEVHRPLLAESDEGWESVEPLPYLKDTEEHRRQLAKYHKLIERADAGVGAILKSLEDTGLAKNTLVIFTTDHGVPFPGAKLTLYDAGLHIAGILRAPGRIPAGRVVSSLTSGVDLLPTMLDLCGIAYEEDQFDGRSFAAALRKSEETTREYVFAERAMPALMRSVRDERYKYILNFDELPPSRLMGAEELTTALSMSVPDFLRRKNRTEELFDLKEDPLESENLAHQPEFAEVRERLNAVLRKWMADTQDPVLRRDAFTPRFEEAWKLANAS